LKDTEDRVLAAACRIFADKGYRDATVADVCAAADANVAAVNYYFGSKRKLYLAVWQHMWEIVHAQYSDTAAAIVADPVQRLREMIFMRVRDAFDDGLPGRFRRLVHFEMGDPTEAHDEIMERFMGPMIELLTATMAELLGREPSDPVVRRCTFSLQSQIH